MSLMSDIGTAIKNKLGGTSVDNTVPRYNGTTCTMQGSGVTISDTNVVTASGGFVGNLTGNANTATTATKLNDAVEATTATANTIVKRDASGYIYTTAVNSTLEDTATAATHYYCETNSDGWLRPKPIADVKAELFASPALTGTPTAPTAAAGTNTTQIATTAFVKAKSEADSIGVNQTWQNVTASRSVGVTYTNNTGKPIVVIATGATGASTSGSIYGYIDNIKISSQSAFTSSIGNIVFIVPNNSTYKITVDGAMGINLVQEFR